MPDAVLSRPVESRDRSLAAPGSVEALVTWTSAEGHMMVASIGDDGTIRRWDATAGTEIGDSLLVDAGRPTALTYWSGHNGPMLASGHSDGTIRRWDATSGVPIGKPLTGHSNWIRALIAWRGPDGHTMLASGSDDGTIRRWDATTGAALGVSRGGGRHVRRSSRDWVLALTVWRNPDGRILFASGSQGAKLRLWDAATGASVGDLPTGNAWDLNVLVTWRTSDGHITLAAGSKGEKGIIRRWDVVASVSGSSLTAHTEDVRHWPPG
jgi:WD40 repeat protein